MGVVGDVALEEAEARIGAMLLGKWRIERLIGVGGMAAVYAASHRNESRVAVKVLHRGAAMSKAQLARFKREGRAANRVGHPGVVEVFDDDVDEQGSPFLVMELLEGKTVAELAKEQGGRLPVERVLDLADQLLDVLAAAHAKGILHRDVKPENVFVTTAGSVKVLDFGIARVAEPEPSGTRTLDGAMLGTPAFSPPEQARGRVAEMDERSDVWAVGATMFTLLSGRLVHTAETTNEQLGLAMSLDAPSLATAEPQLPSAIVALVDRALAYERRDRWPSARAMQEAVQTVRRAGDWDAFGGDAVTGHGVSEPRAAQTRGSKLNARWRVVIAAALAAMAAAGLTVASRRSMKDTSASARVVTVNPPLAEAKPSAWLAAAFEPAPPLEPVHAPARSDVAPQLGASRRARALARPRVPQAPVAPAADVESSEPPSSPFDRRH